MLTGLIRAHETRTIDIEGHSIADIREKLTAAASPGWELTSAPVAMVKGSTVLTATGTFQRIDGLSAIDADTMPALE
ncbi:hypothetical protein ACKI2C_48170, partial [Streptomyces brasiliscabiei]|uniref:hypothetical protein n=1 Tax=Streptomyces brasiliscabiei TaxID=2736302 RepID=UPI0038F71C70